MLRVHLKIDFVISDIVVYVVKFFLLNIQEATRLLDLDKPNVTNLLRIFNFFLRKLMALLSLKQLILGSVKHGDIKFWFSRNAYTGKHWL